ncbi:isopeptide-forming domain-containing fimbrial protein [Microbacterium sp. MC2]
MRSTLRQQRREQKLRRGKKLTALAAAVSLVVGGLIAVAGAQVASAQTWTPETSITPVAAEGKDFVLAGEDVTFDLAVRNDGGGEQFNLAVAALVRADVAFVGSSASLGTPVQYAAGAVLPNRVGSTADECADAGLEPAASPANRCAVPAGMQLWVWSNVNDLPDGGVVNGSVTVRPTAGAYPVGSAVDLAVRAYTSDDPTMLPTFDGSTSVATTSDHTSQPGTATGTVDVRALRVVKTETTSPENELLRGVHDNPATYSVRVEYTGEGDTTGVTVTDYLPAGLEYLGLSGGDNSTGDEEYDGSGRIPGTWDHSMAETVETVDLDAAQASALGLAGAGVYTKVTWSIGDLTDGTAQTGGAAGIPGFYEFSYTAAIPLFENAMWPEGTAPSVGSGGQAANLDNNTGASTRHGDEDDYADAQSLTNAVSVAGTYGGAVFEGDEQWRTATDDDTETVDAVDLRVVKTVLDEDAFTTGTLATYRLDIATSEYMDAGGITLTDVIPNGLCPAFPANSDGSTPDLLIDGVPAADWNTRVAPDEACNYPSEGAVLSAGLTVTAIDYDTGAGTFTASFALADLDAGETVHAEYTVMQRPNYTGVGGGTSSGDAFTNHVEIFGTTTPIDVIGDDTELAKRVGGEWLVTDDSAATITSAFAALTKTVLERGVTPAEATDEDWKPTADTAFSPGDTVWYRMQIPFAEGIDTRNAKLSDYLPVGVEYAGWSAELVDANGAEIDDIENYVALTPASPSATTRVLTWAFGAQNRQPSSTDRFMPAGSEITIYLEGVVTAQSASRDEVDSPENHAKYQQRNVDGVLAFLRADAGVDLDWGATLNKGIFAVNGTEKTGAFGDRDQDESVVQGDTVEYRIDVTAPQNTTRDYVVWDVLPAGVTAADVSPAFEAWTYDGSGYSGIESAVSAAAYDDGDTLPDGISLSSDYEGRSIVAWTISTDIEGSTAGENPVTRGFSLGYTLTVPAGVTDGGAAAQLTQSYRNTAGIVSYDVVNNGTRTTTLVPQTADGEQHLTSRTPGSDEVGVSDTDTYDSATVTLPGAEIEKELLSTQLNGGGNSDGQITQGEYATFRYSITIPAKTSVAGGVLADNGSFGGTTYTFVEGSAAFTGPAGVDLDARGFTQIGTDTSPYKAGTLVFPDTYTNSTSAAQVFTAEITVYVGDLSHTAMLTNTASFTHDDPNGGPAVSLTDTAQVQYVEPSPSLDKTVTDPANGQVAERGTATYTLTASNAAGRPALYDTVVYDCIPVKLTNPTALNPSQGDVEIVADQTCAVVDGQIVRDAGTGTLIRWDAGTIEGGSSATLTYTVTVDATAGSNESFTNYAELTGYTLPGSLSGAEDRRGERTDDANATVSLPPASITKSVSPTAAPIGETVTYTLNTTLPANANYYDVALTDTLPAGVDYVTGSAEVTTTGAGAPTVTTEPTVDDRTLTWAVNPPSADVASSVEARTITITFDGLITDDVAAAAPRNAATFAWNALDGDDESRAADTDTADVTILHPRVAIAKKVDGQDAVQRTPDAEFTYTLAVTNTGGTPAHHITITDAVPAGVIVDADTISHDGELTGADEVTGGGTITWTLAGPIDHQSGSGADKLVSLTYDARFAASSELTATALVNTAEVTGYESFDDGGRTYVPGENGVPEATDTASVQPLFPAVELGKSVVAGQTEAFVDETFAWQLSAVNTGSGPAQTITLTDTLPANWVYDPDFDATVQVGAGAPAALGVPTLGSDSEGRVTLTWTFGADAPATPLLPGTVPGATEEQRTLTVLFAAKPLAAARDDAGTTAASPHTNTVSAVTTDTTGSDRNQTGSYTGPDAAADAFIGQADLLLQKSAVGGVIDAGDAGAADNLYGLDAGTWVAGQAVVADQYAQPQWQVTITNQGPDAGHGPFRVTDAQTLPAGVTSGLFTAWYYAAGATTGTPLDLDGSGTADDPFVIGDNATALAADGTDRIVLVADVTVAAGATGDAANTADVRGRTYEDPDDFDDNGDTAEQPIVAQADLEIEKTTTTVDPNAGSSISWNLTVRNNGPSVAVSTDDKTITVTDVIPAGITAVTQPAAVAGWTVTTDADGGWPAAAGDTVTWTFTGDSIAVNVEYDFTLTGTVLSSWTGTITNTAEVHPGETPDPDGDNNDSETPVTPGDDTTLGIDKTRVVYVDGAWRSAAELGESLPEVVAGDTASYRVTVANTGPADARSVRVLDEPPAELTYDTHESVTGTWTRTAGGGDDLFALGDPLVAGGSAVFVVTYTIDDTLVAGTDLTNLVTASADNATNDPDDTEGVETTRQANLSMLKQVIDADGIVIDDATVTAGTEVRYRLTVTNEGPSISSAPIDVTDTLPAGLTFVSSTVSVAGAAAEAATPTDDDGELTWTDLTAGAALAVDDTIVIELLADIVPTVGAQTLTNSATVDGPEDFDPTDDTDTEDVDIVTAADMSIDKVVEDGPWIAGTDVEYTITVTNDGPSAVDARVHDVLPAGLTPVSITGAGWTCTDATQTCTYPQHPVGSSTLTVTATIGANVPTGTELVNTATLTWTDGDGPHTDSDPAEIAVTTDADLALAKRAVDADGETITRVVAGSTARYELVVSNEGPSDAVATLTVTDTLPAGTRFSSLVSTVDWTAVASIVPDGDPQTVVFTRNPATAGLLDGADAPAIVYEVYVDAAVPQDSVLTNTATVSSGTPDSDPANDDADASVTVDARADLGIVKSHTGTPTAGEEFEWTIAVTNHGDSDSLATPADPIVVSDTLPDGVTLVSATSDSPGSVCDTEAVDGVFACEIGATMAPGDTVTLTVRVAVAEDVSGTLVNTATVTPSLTPEPTEPVHPNESTDETDPVREVADLAVEKIVLTDPDDIVAGGSISWQITVTNLGPSNSDATADDPIVVTDQLPAGVTLDAVVVPNDDWSCDSGDGTLTCELPADLATDDPQVFTVTATVDPSAQGRIDNVVTVEPGLTPQPADHEFNDRDEVTSVLGESADLRLLKGISAEIVAGDTGRYVLQVFNDGPSTARGITVTDALPDTLTFVGVVGDDAGLWTCDDADPREIVCAYAGTLAPGAEPLTLEIEVAAAADLTGDVTNVAVVGATTPDPDPANNDDTETGTFVTTADLTVTKTHDAEAPIVAGGELTWTVTVANNGPSDSVATDAQPIVVTDVLPAGTTFVADGSSETCVMDAGDARLVVCEIAATIAAGESVALEIRVAIDQDVTGDLTNTVRVAPALTPDTDTTNNEAFDTVAVTEVADLTIAKTVATPADDIVAGGRIAWTLTASNLGPSNSDATADDPITVVDTLPAGVSFVEAAGDGWVCVAGESSPDDRDTVVCERADDLAVGDAPVITVTGLIAPDVQGEIRNDAVVAPGLTAEPAGGEDNNDADAVSPVSESADLALSKAVTEAITAGGSGAYTLVVTNLGPSSARNITVTDTLPDGLAYAGVDGDGWSCEAGDGDADVVCAYDGVLAPAASTSFILKVTAEADLQGDIVNTAVVATTTPDPNDENDTATATGVIAELVDLSIEKIAVGEAIVGEEFAYELTVANAGPSDARGVRVEDAVPAGLEVVSASGDGWSCAVDGTANQVACLLDELAAGETAPVVTLQVRVLPGAYPEVENTATVTATSPEGDDTLADNSSTATVPVPPLSDLVVTKTLLDELVTGQQARYEVTVVNEGPTEDPGIITVTDDLPDGLTARGWSMDGAEGECATDVTTFTCTVERLAVGQRVTLVLTVDVAPGAIGTIVNTVTATSDADPAGAAASAAGEVTVVDLPSTGGVLAPYLPFAIALLLLGAAAIWWARRRDSETV